LGIHMYTLQDDGSLVFSGYNPAADAILGIDHGQNLGKSIENAFPGLATTEIPTVYREVARAGGVWNSDLVDYSHHPIQGAFTVHAFQTVPGKMVTVFDDISERIRAQETLRVSEEKFSKAFVTSPDAVNINRMSDGLYININQGFTRLTGYTPDEVVGKSSLELNIWTDPKDRARLVQGLMEKGEVENLEAGFRRKNGEVGIGLMSAKVIVIEGEKCILSITRDVTERIQAEISLREAHVKLEEAYGATLQGWARALEIRERETADHSHRVEELTVQTSRALGVDERELVHIRRGALLHDIGKIGVPDSILLKPGPLTADEWVIMRQHPNFAMMLLKDIKYLSQSVSIPYCHHEKWDGSGYPRGLKGEEIPISARIFAVVDVYDALSHDRPYRPAWPEADTRRYLLDQCGKHFDPRIVKTFLSILE
jgi:PAS domain S-box-containing protein